MPIYKIQHKLSVLLHNHASLDKREVQDEYEFTVENIVFRPWPREKENQWRAGEWLAEVDIEAGSLNEAIDTYGYRMTKIIPRISFVGQAYVEDRHAPLFIKRSDKDFGWYRAIRQTDPYPLDFMPEQKQALDRLLTNTDISDNFFYYWKDAVNTTSYTAKLLLMFGAIDCLAKNDDRKKTRIDILGEELAEEIFAQKTGLRNRLSHGEYLEGSDNKDYVDLVHKAILKYFNAYIFQRELLTIDVTTPQRGLYGNYERGDFFVKRMNPGPSLDIYGLVEDTEQNGCIPTKYEKLWINVSEY